MNTSVLCYIIFSSYQSVTHTENAVGTDYRTGTLTCFRIWETIKSYAFDIYMSKADYITNDLDSLSPTDCDVMTRFVAPH
jgi:hypothetical protein